MELLYNISMTSGGLAFDGDLSGGTLTALQPGIYSLPELTPGDLCETTCRLTGRLANVCTCEVRLDVGGRRCCRGTITFALVEKN